MNANMNTNGLNLYSTSRHYTILHVLVVLISFLCATHIRWIRIILTWNERKLHMNILNAIIQIPNAHLCFRIFWFHRFSFVVCCFSQGFWQSQTKLQIKSNRKWKKNLKWPWASLLTQRRNAATFSGRKHTILARMSLAPSLSFIRSKWCNRTQ